MYYSSILLNVDWRKRPDWVLKLVPGARGPFSSRGERRKSRDERQERGGEEGGGRREQKAERGKKG